MKMDLILSLIRSILKYGEQGYEIATKNYSLSL